jgi:hypothetical protein
MVLGLGPVPDAVGEINAGMAAVFPEFQVAAAGVVADGFLSFGKKGLKIGAPLWSHGKFHDTDHYSNRILTVW